MEEPIRVAIIGCGWAGKRHAQAYEQCGAEIRWAVDVDREQGHAVPEGYCMTLLSMAAEESRDPRL